jgi:hypothetical protein
VCQFFQEGDLLISSYFVTKEQELLGKRNRMFGNLTGSTAPSGSDWGERMLNTVASQSIRHLFSQCDDVEVVIRCNPSSKLLQGSIDSFKMNGRGLVIRRDFPVEKMSFETDAVALDFSSILSGKIRLKQPTQAVAEVILCEDGINQSFKAELVTKRLRNIDLPALTELTGGAPVSFSEVGVRVQPQNRLRISAKAELPNGSIVPICLTVTLAIERRRRILFKEPQFEADAVPESLRETSRTLAAALAQILDNMVDLDRFDLDGVMMRLNRLETQGKKLIFSGYAQIDHFPRNP